MPNIMANIWQRAVMESAEAISRDRKQDEFEPNQLLQAIVHSSPLGIIVTDNMNRVKIWNEAAQNIFQWTEKEILDQSLPIVPQHQRGEIHPNKKKDRAGRQPDHKKSPDVPQGWVNY